MSPTNVHHMWSLLDRAGTNFSDQVTIQPFGRLVYMVYNNMSQAKLDRFKSLLNCRHEGVWVSKAGSNFEKFEIVPAVYHRGVIPRLCITQAFKWVVGPSEPNFDRAKSITADENAEPLRYVLIVQGLDAGERWKILVEDSLSDAASAIMHEALNCYSIVFSGAMFTSDVDRLFSQSWTRLFKFIFVDSVEGLVKVKQGSRRLDSIGVIC